MFTVLGGLEMNKNTHTYIAKDATVLRVSKWGGQRFDLAEDIEQREGPMHMATYCQRKIPVSTR